MSYRSCSKACQVSLTSYRRHTLPQTDFCFPQLTHYPSHRAPCRRNARGREQVEHMVLAHPVFANANMDSEEHLKSILGDAMMAARSALRLGKPDSLAQTHVLILRFNYDSKPVQLRERFKLAEVIVRSFDEHLKLSQPSLHPSIRRIMPSSNTVPRSFWSLPGETDGFYVGLIHETVLLMDNKPVTMSQRESFWSLARRALTNTPAQTNRWSFHRGCPTTSMATIATSVSTRTGRSCFAGRSLVRRRLAV